MKRTNLPSTARRLMLFVITMFYGVMLWAQAPSQLNYPTPVEYYRNVSNVFLSPTVSGNVASYSISPNIVSNTGLSFDVNTGIISGIPNIATAGSQIYTITATNGVGFTTKQISINVKNNYFDNSNGNSVYPINFGGAAGGSNPGTTNVSIEYYRNGSLTNAANKGRVVGDVILYKNAAIYSGQPIDCKVTIQSISTGSSIAQNDEDFPDQGDFHSNNQRRFYALNSSMGSNGSIVLGFKFIKGGSFGSNEELAILQNVQINTYDVDGGGNTGGEQSVFFGDFTQYEIVNGTGSTANNNNNVSVVSIQDGLTEFKAMNINNIGNILDSRTRVRVHYSNLSEIAIRLKGLSTAYYFLDFSAGGQFVNPTPSLVVAPSVDLNTNTIGVNNESEACGSYMNFATGGNNVIAPVGGNYDSLLVSLPASQILNGSDEKLYFNGVNGVQLDITSGSSSTVTGFIGGQSSNPVYFVWRKRTEGTNSVFSFYKVTTSQGTTPAGTFNIVEAQALIGAISYRNDAPQATNGKREFTVNLKRQFLQSPDAIFTANVNCVSLSGHIYHDINGMTNNSVNHSATAYLPTGFMKAVLTNSAGVVLNSASINNTSGAYTFGQIAQDKYKIFIVPGSATVNNGTTLTQSSLPTVGVNFSTLPTGMAWTFTGESILPGATGNDGSANGVLEITLGSQSITDANFGIQIPPRTLSATLSDRANPGSFNYSALGNAFTSNITEVDGNINTLTIKGFPTNTNVLKVGTTVYTNGNTSICPPLTTCTAWPASDSINIPYADAGNISIDPIDGAVSSVITYSVADNGNAKATFPTNSTITVPFTVASSMHSLSGYVWNDDNGDGAIAGAGEPYTAGPVATSTDALYAILVQTNNTYNNTSFIYQFSTVNPNSGTYSFSNVAAGNQYSIRLARLDPSQFLQATPAYTLGSDATTIPTNLGANYIGVSTNPGGSTPTPINPGVYNPAITIANLSGDLENLNFGIEQKPTATDVVGGPFANITNDLTRFTVPALRGSDPEDMPIIGDLTGRTVRFTTPLLTSSTGTFYYDNVSLVPNQSYLFANYEPTKLEVDPNFVGVGNIVLPFNYVDSAGELGAIANVTMTFSACIPPSVTAQPVDAKVCNNIPATPTTVTFGVTATGNGLTYQWQANTGVANAFENIPNGGFYSNVTTPVLTISNATANINNVQYRVVITGTCGTVNSEARALTVTTLSPQITEQTNVSCHGGNNGSFEVMFTGGTPPYTAVTSGWYSWGYSLVAPYWTFYQFTNRTAGTYSVTMRDVNQCESTQAVEITQPTAFSGLNLVSQTDNLCNGGSNGAISVTPATGGTGTITYNWTPGTPTGDGTTSVSGLSAGSYTVTATDEKGCTKAQSFTITEPSAIAGLALSSRTNVSCFNGSNGAISVTPATGGTGTIIYDWTPGTPTGDGTTSVTGLSEGTYTITAIDANGCTSSLPVTITEPTALSDLALASSTNVSCFGGSNGTISVTPATGGTGTITYDWTPGTPTGEGTTSITGLSEGTYTITATDANGCTRSLPVTITEPAEIVNTVSLTIKSSETPYTFGTNTGLVSSGATAHVFTAANGCDSTVTLNLTVTPVTISGTVFHDINGNTDNLVNGGTNTLPTYLIAVLYKIGSPATVTASMALTNGTFHFDNVQSGNYAVLISNSPLPLSGAALPDADLPANWMNTGEALATNAIDGAANGIYTVGELDNSVSDIRFGIQQRPFANNNEINDVPNPGGYNTYTVPNGGVDVDDDDGTIASITVTSFPDNANSITLNNTTYVSTSGNCQPSTNCTVWSGPVTVPFTLGNPTQPIMIDPIDGEVTVSIPFVATDNAGAVSTLPGKLDIDFKVVALSGYVWADGNATLVGKENHERYVSGIATTVTTTTVTSTGANLYATLVDASNKVIQSVAVAADGSYTLGNTPPNTIGLKIILSTTTAIVGADAPMVILPTEWVNIGEVATTSVQSNTLGLIDVSTASVDIAGQHFAINHYPTATPLNVASQVNPGGIVKVTLPALIGTDPEDGLLNGTGNKNKIVINTLPSATTGILYYNNVAITAGQIIPEYNPTLLTVDPASGAQIVEFTFSQIDSAGKPSIVPATVTVLFTAITIGGSVHNDVDGLLGTPLNTIDGNPTNAGGLNAVLYSDSTVLGVYPILSDGLFSFPNRDAGAYSVLITSAPAIVNGAVPAIELPFNWVHTGEYDAIGAGNDLNVNGLIYLYNIAIDKTNIRFGIEELPTALNMQTTTQTNPGGVVEVAVPANKFGGTDLSDGEITYIKLTIFPENTTTIKVNGIAYSNSTWPVAGLLIPTNPQGQPTQPITLDPIDGAITAILHYLVIDNAGKSSLNTATTLLPFGTIGISGTVYNDANGMTDNMVNASGTGLIPANLNAVLVASNTDIILQTIPVNPTTGLYSFTELSAGIYRVIITDQTAIVESTSLPIISLPNGWLRTGEIIGSGNGTDAIVDGVLLTPNINAILSNVNFGIQKLPLALSTTAPSVVNPGANNFVPVSGFAGADEHGGNITSLRITSFPTNTTAITINGTTYTANNWPTAGVSTPTDANGAPITTVALDPVNGQVNVVVDYKVTDNANMESIASGTLTVPFHTLAISGTLYNDANGLMDNMVNGTGFNPSGMRAILVNQATGKVVGVQIVGNNGIYNFANLVNGNYEVYITTTTASLGANAPVVTLPSGWVSTGEQIASAPADALANSILNINLTGNNITNANFGIERLPTAISATTTVPLPTVGTLFTLNAIGGNPPIPTATDPEDGVLAAGKTIVIASLPNNSNLLYNGTAVTPDQVITGFIPAQLQVQVTSATVGSSNTSFTFNYMDAAGKVGTLPATYTLDWGVVLPVKMGDFTAKAEGDKAKLEWVTYTEQNNKGFYVERSKDGRNWKEIGFTTTLAENGNSNEELVYLAYDNAPMAGLNQYRLRQVDNNGKATYSVVRELNFVFAEHKISVYPNPATDRVHLKVTDWSTIKSVLMLDVNGREVYRSKNDEAQSGLDMNGLADGTYLLIVEQEGNRIDKFKVVKKQ